MKRIILTSLFIFSQASLLFAFSVVVNTGEQIKNGQVTVTAPPFDIGSINDIFDNDINSLARTPNINPAIITLQFAKPFTLSASKLYMITDGRWTLECALSLTDLDSHSGSYHLIFSNDKVINSVWDTIGFAPVDAKVVRLTAKRTQCCDGYVHISEWQLFATPSLTSLCFSPGAAKLLPGTSFTVQLLGRDNYGNEYQLPNAAASWSSSKPAVATTDNAGTISGLTTGISIISVQYTTLHYSLPALVFNTFSTASATKRIVKAALVIQDPVIAEAGEQRLHTIFGWNDPYTLALQVADSLEAVSHGTVEYQFTTVYNDTNLFTYMQGTHLSVDSMYHLLNEPGWTTLYANGTNIDYNQLLAYYDFCDESNSGSLDEIWLMGFPWAGYYESELAGQNAFWYNAPPLNEGNSCVGLLPIMGFNYERDWPEALHSYGHRVESTMSQLFGGWTYDGTPANLWELFASINIYNIGASYAGNIHFPPNGVSDYDYGNTTLVNNYAENFNYYPYLYHLSKVIDCSEWECNEGGYMSWWFRHVPHAKGRGTDGVLFSWWPYIIDYENGLKEAGTVPLCSCTKCTNPPEIISTGIQLPGGLRQLGTRASYPIYFWSTGETTAAISYSSDDSLQLVVEDRDGCIYNASFQAKSDHPGFNLSIVPTLATDHISMELSDTNDEMIEVKIYDAGGREMDKCSVALTGSKLTREWNVTSYAGGIYFLEAKSIAVTKTIRFVVAKD